MIVSKNDMESKCLKLDNSELIIELKGVKFFAFHGLYEEERRVGGEYIVNLTVKYEAGDEKVNKIEKTINYENLYEIIKAEMKQTRDLLETIAVSVSEKINKQFSQVKEVEIRIEKKNPPIVNFSGGVAVTYRKQF